MADYGLEIPAALKLNVNVEEEKKNYEKNEQKNTTVCLVDILIWIGSNNV